MSELKPIEPCGQDFGPEAYYDDCGKDNLCPGCLEKDRDRYKELFELAMDFIEKSPGDPDIYDDQIDAWIKLQDLIND